MLYICLYNWVLWIRYFFSRFYQFLSSAKGCLNNMPRRREKKWVDGVEDGFLLVWIFLFRYSWRRGHGRAKKKNDSDTVQSCNCSYKVHKFSKRKNASCKKWTEFPFGVEPGRCCLLGRKLKLNLDESVGHSKKHQESPFLGQKTAGICISVNLSPVISIYTLLGSSPT